MATKHLYLTDGVAATLLYAIETGDSVLACQAATELRTSSDIWCILTLAWLLQDPAHPLQGIRCSAFAAHDELGLLDSLLGSPAPLPPFATVFPVDKPVREALPLPLPPLQGWTPGQTAKLYLAVKDALRTRNWRRATHLTAHLLEHTPFVVALLSSLGVHSSICTLLETTVFAPLLPRVLAHAYTSVCVPLEDTQKEKKQEKEQYKGKDKEGRTFHIPAAALATWHVTPAPTSQLIGEPIFLEHSPYWSPIMAKLGVQVVDRALVFKDDTSLETFYDLFPQDIPDEWSCEERAKSHGHQVEWVPNPWAPAFLLCT